MLLDKPLNMVDVKNFRTGCTNLNILLTVWTFKCTGISIFDTQVRVSAPAFSLILGSNFKTLIQTFPRFFGHLAQPM